MATIKDKLGNWLGRMRESGKPVKVDVQRGGDQEQTPQNKDVSIAQLKQGYSEVVETMQSVRKHLETQGQRSERMMEMFEGMPEILKSIPETNRAQVRLLEAIHANLDRQNETSTELSSAIQGLTKAADTQQNTMTKIKEHLHAEDEARREMLTGVDTLNTTLDGVKESNESARATLTSISDQAAMREERLVEMFDSARKTQTMMSIVAWVLALAALCVAFYVAVQASYLQTAAPVVTAPLPAPADPVVESPEPAVPDTPTSPVTPAAPDPVADEPAPLEPTADSTAGADAAPTGGGETSIVSDSTSAGDAAAPAESSDTTGTEAATPTDAGDSAAADADAAAEAGPTTAADPTPVE